MTFIASVDENLYDWWMLVLYLQMSQTSNRLVLKFRIILRTRTNLQTMEGTEHITCCFTAMIHIKGAFFKT